MRFAVEAWDPDYGTGVDAEGLDPSTDVVDASLEVATSRWHPIRPLAPSVPDTVWFVDGVRRIDARIWVSDDSAGGVIAGSCATVAAGTVVCTDRNATVDEVRVMRGVFTPPLGDATAIETDAGRYEHVTVRSASPEDLYLGIHEEMTRLETAMIPTDPAADDLIVFDGPLRGRSTPRAIGYIKTQHVQYLETADQSVVPRLEPGERTPLFRIGSSSFARWSWYVRLPGPRTHGWAGVIRAEASTAWCPDVAEAIEFADTVAATLPRFASEPHKEPRAPQNLYPITGLEHALRRRLGDQRLLQRALRQAAR